MFYRRALVTGASRGIGRALAIELAESGARVVLVGRDRATLDLVNERIRALGGASEVVVADVSRADEWARRLRDIDRSLGGLDLVVANAGVGVPSRDALPYAWESVSGAFETNVVGATATLTALVPAMIARGAGHLVSIGSISSYAALPFSEAYCAPKAAIDMLLDCLRLDLRGTGVAVTNVRLGFVRTQMTSPSQHPMPGLLEPDEVARLVVRRLPARPRTIALPRWLALTARAAALAPSGARDAFWATLGKMIVTR